MGFVSSVIREIPDNSEEGRFAKELLSISYELAKAKIDAFEYEIKNRVLNRGSGYDDMNPAPANVLLASAHEVYAVKLESMDKEKLVKRGSDVIKSLSSGDSFARLISNLIIGSKYDNILDGYASESAFDGYFLHVEEHGFVRYDYRVWWRRVENGALKKYLDKVLACLVVKTAVDVSKMNFNGFISAYSYQLKMAGVSPEDIAAELARSRDVYQKVRH